MFYNRYYINKKKISTFVNIFWLFSAFVTHAGFKPATF